MGLDISKITNQKLRKLANECDNKDKNYGNLNQEEYEIFRSKAGEVKGVSNKSFNQAMGLYISEPISSTEATSVAAVTTEQTEETPEESNKYSRKENVNKKYEQAETNALIKHLTYAVNIKEATREDIISKLPEGISQEDKDAIQEVLDKMPEYTSVKEVKASHKDLVKEIGKENKKQIAILNLLENLAIMELRAETYNELKEKAEEISDADDSVEIMTRKHGKQARKALGNDKEAKIAYRTLVEDEIGKQARTAVAEAVYSVENEFDEEGNITSEAPTKRRAVVKEAKVNLKEDKKWTTDTHKNLTGGEFKYFLTGEESHGRMLTEYQAAKNRVEQSIIQTDAEIVKTMGNKLEALIAMKDIEVTKRDILGRPEVDENGNEVKIKLASYNEETGEWNLEGLSQEIKYAVGLGDLELNRDHKIDKLIAEKLRALGALSTSGEVNLTNAEVKKLVKLCGFDIEAKDWRGILGGAIAGFGIGAGSAALGQKLNDRVLRTQESLIEASPKQYEIEGVKNPENINIKTPEGIEIDIEIIKENSIIVNFSQLIHIPSAIIELAGKVGTTALLGGVVPAIVGALAGMEDKGQTAITSINFTEENFEAYTERNKVENPEYAPIINALAACFVNEDGDWDHEAYKDYLNVLAGDGNKLNHKELLNGLRSCSEIKPKLNVTKNYATVESSSTEEVKEEVDLTYIHRRKGGDSWKGIVTAYYPELVEAYGLYGKDGAIKRLQRALAVDENGVYDNAIFRAIINATDLPKEILLPSKIDGYARVIGVVVPVSITATERNGSGNGQYIAALERVGIEEVSITRIPGTTTYVARDVNDSEKTASGSSKDEALKKLQETYPEKKYILKEEKEEEKK